MEDGKDAHHPWLISGILMAGKPLASGRAAWRRPVCLPPLGGVPGCMVQLHIQGDHLVVRPWAGSVVARRKKGEQRHHIVQLHQDLARNSGCQHSQGDGRPPSSQIYQCCEARYVQPRRWTCLDEGHNEIMSLDDQSFSCPTELELELQGAILLPVWRLVDVQDAVGQDW